MRESSGTGVWEDKAESVNKGWCRGVLWCEWDGTINWCLMRECCRNKLGDRRRRSRWRCAIQNYKNLDLWVLGPWRGWHAPWCRRIIHIHAPPCAVQEILSSVVHLKEYLRYRGDGLVSSFVWSRLANGEPILADVWSVFYKTCCAGRGHTREHSWSATAATTCGRMGTAFFRTGTCISRLDNFDHVRTKRVWNWHDCFLWQNSGQVRYVQMWCPQFCSIEEKGLCPSMVLPEFCNLEAWHEKEVVGSWLIRRTWVRPSSPALCQTLLHWNYFQCGVGATCCLIRFFPLLRLVIFSCCCARMST